MQPSKKSPAMEKAIDNLSQGMFGRPRTETIAANNCVTCGKPAHQFRDELSRKEYKISGMCQECQDSVF